MKTLFVGLTAFGAGFCLASLLVGCYPPISGAGLVINTVSLALWSFSSD